MKHRISALFLGTALALAAGSVALAQDKTVKIGVLTDNSGLYSDLGGAGSTLAAQMAIEDSGMQAKGWKIDLISADHQNKPDIATTIARQWIDVEKVGGDTWYFLTADYAFGAALERDTTAVILKSGGKVLGTVKHPLNSSDFSSFLLQAQASKAKIVGMANAGGDTTNTIKQASEFGIVA